MPKITDGAEMLHQMVQELSNADLSAIRKARGFSKEEAASRAVFETFFLSSIGVEAALAVLTEAEIATLYLMSRLDRAVNIEFFSRLYGDGRNSKQYYYATPTQQYKETYAQVHTNLVRRGVLLMVLADESPSSSKMERWRFRFPAEFNQFLPRLIHGPAKIDLPGEAKQDVLRKKVLEITSGPRSDPIGDKQTYRLHLVSKQLYLGKQPFRVKRLRQWQQACWAAAARLNPGEAPETIAPLEAITSLLAQLEPGEWLLPDQLVDPLKIFCYGLKIAKAEQICAAGWQWGCLARCEQGTKTYYRLSPQLTQQNLPELAETDEEEQTPAEAPGESEDPGHFILLNAAYQGITIDLRKIPFEALALLGEVSDLQLVDGRLIAAPNRVRIGRLEPKARKQPLLEWLQEASPLYRDAFAAMQGRWGRQIVHSGLLVARVKDLSLKVQIERAFEGSGQVIALSDEYLAFPSGNWEEIEKLIRKAGFVVRQVQAK